MNDLPADNGEFSALIQRFFVPPRVRLVAAPP